MNTAFSSSPASTSKTNSQPLRDFPPVKALPDAGNSATCVSDSTDEQREEAIRQAGLDMQRAMVRWDIFGTFDCAAEYTLARARWVNLQAEGRIA